MGAIISIFHGAGSKNKHSLFDDQDYNKLKRHCLKHGKLFVDDYFPHDVEDAEWFRPKDIVKDPKFFVEGASRFDVVQGDNSGCWLLVAMANLTLKPVCFNRVVPKDQSFSNNYAGIFHFNIWQIGTWTQVVIDDLLPTTRNLEGSKQLKFVHSRENNEFWSALLEKAYAKLYGSYNNLTTGWFNEAMVDFTGGIVERYDVSPDDKDLGKIISRSLEKDSFLCVYMLDDPTVSEMVLKNGLVKGHAYSVTKAQTVSYKGESVLLIRLRNPWGKTEWTGAWSDASLQWSAISPEDRNKISLVKREDGEFWMSISDFSKNFEYIDICHLSPDSVVGSGGKFAWETHFFKGQWTKGVNAGGYSLDTFHLNTQYRLSLSESNSDDDGLCSILIGLMQKNKTREIWHQIGFTYFLLEGPEKESKKRLSEQYITEHFKDSTSSDFLERREVVVRDKWKPGVYCIIPSTFRPDEEGEYLLRVYSEGKSLMKEHKKSATSVKLSIKNIDQENKLLKKNEREVIEYFHDLKGKNNEIDWKGLQSILEFSLHDDSTHIVRKKTSWTTLWVSGPVDTGLFTKEECCKIIDILSNGKTGRLSLKEFKILWNKLQSWETVYMKHSKKYDSMETEELRNALKEIGHNLDKSDIDELVKKYGDDDGKIGFDDFVMCSITLDKS